MYQSAELTKALLNIKMAVAAAKKANEYLDIYKSINTELPISVGHILAYGPPGCGKTMSIEHAAKIMHCSEKVGNFIRINADTFKKGSELTSILQQKLSWNGYLCNHNKINHDHCPRCNHYIIDPINPVGPLNPQLVFLDEIHVLPEDLQEQLGLILLDFRYQVRMNGELKTVYFPRFTFAGATTKPGDLLRPLRTRFSIKIGFNYYSDDEMIEVVNTIANKKRIKLDNKTTKIIANIAQGIPREAENHIKGVYNCWIYKLEHNESINPYIITEDVTNEYIKIQNFMEDGLSYDQIKVLVFLSNFKDNKKQSFKAVGVSRICNFLGMDQQRFYDEIEPRLSYRGYVTSGSRGREITEEGFEYLKQFTSKDIVEDLNLYL